MKDERLYLIQMLERVERIEAYTPGGRAEFLSDPKTQDAVVRSFEVMGEAQARLGGSARLAADLVVEDRRLPRLPDPPIRRRRYREIWKRSSLLGVLDGQEETVANVLLKMLYIRVKALHAVSMRRSLSHRKDRVEHNVVRPHRHDSSVKIRDTYTLQQSA